MELWRVWEWLYAYFNYSEAFIWMAIGCGLLWKQRGGYFKFGSRQVIFTAAITFFFFGISDLFEATCESNGVVPLWIWAWKIFCGAVLVKCRYDYTGINRTKIVDSYSIFLLITFLIVLVLVVWSWLLTAV